jgi:hypothetical protein
MRLSQSPLKSGAACFAFQNLQFTAASFKVNSELSDFLVNTTLVR